MFCSSSSTALGPVRFPLSSSGRPSLHPLLGFHVLFLLPVPSASSSCLSPCCSFSSFWVRFKHHEETSPDLWYSISSASPSFSTWCPIRSLYEDNLCIVSSQPQLLEGQYYVYSECFPMYTQCSELMNNYLKDEWNGHLIRACETKKN